MLKRKYTNLGELSGYVKILLMQKGFNEDQINRIYNKIGSTQNFQKFVQLTQEEPLIPFVTKYHFNLEYITKIASHYAGNIALKALLESARNKKLHFIMQKFNSMQITKILACDGGIKNFEALIDIMCYDSELNNFIKATFNVEQITKILGHAGGAKNLSGYLDMSLNNEPECIELKSKLDINVITQLLSQIGGSLVLQGLLDMIKTKPAIWSKIKAFNSFQIGKILSTDSGGNKKLAFLSDLIENNIDSWDLFVRTIGADKIAERFACRQLDLLESEIKMYAISSQDVAISSNEDLERDISSIDLRNLKKSRFTEPEPNTQNNLREDFFAGNDAPVINIQESHTPLQEQR
ncbi:MAG: hypothetical protein SFT68_04200, partial [Rickettsiaceae bacterium]|nr:hypothetical protein [Rickettsiaceae bacterium]